MQKNDIPHTGVYTAAVVEKELNKLYMGMLGVRAREEGEIARHMAISFSNASQRHFRLIASKSNQGWRGM